MTSQRDAVHETPPESRPAGWRAAWQRAEPVLAATSRGRAKAERRSALLDAAARLFAERGFGGVSIDDLGAAAGVSGPAVYRHFPTKQHLLAAILVGVSTALWDGGERVVAAADDDEAAMRGLVAFHAEFATAASDVIRVQDRDLTTLDEPWAGRVRRLQRDYIALWSTVLASVRPDIAAAQRRIRVQAVFGLINSTPHSLGSRERASDEFDARGVLERMAMAALMA